MENKPPTYWIVGAGNFGGKALSRLARKYPKSTLKLIDQSDQLLKRYENDSVGYVCHEGASYIATHLDSDHPPDWIIPAVPIHLAFEWLRLKMVNEKAFDTIPVPPEIEAMLPNAVRGREGQLFVSYADFICPDNCTEPFDRCTFTGKPRKGLLYKTLHSISFDQFTSVVIRSRQLAPGVGGYRPEALQDSLDQVRACDGPVLFSTACLCHGVIHALMIS